MKTQKPKVLEKVIENQIFHYLKKRGIFCWKNDSVGIFDPVKKIYRSNRNPNRIKGVSDILGILPNGRFLAIEVKAEKGRASPEQVEFLSQIERNGGIGILARSLSDIESEAALFGK